MICRTLLSFFLLLLLSENALALPAFPGAKGFGSSTPGGSGRHLSVPQTKIYRVINLSDSGAGSFRECAEGKEPRICVFEISGRISLKERISIRSPYLTVAGETAPSPGVLFTGAGFRISTSDVILRHLAVRVGDSPDGPKPESRDAITIDGKKQRAENILLDHLSLSWALDENASTYGEQVRAVTFSNSIIAEGLYRSLHPDGPHSMGMLIGEGSQSISVHNCLFANNNDRNPRQKAGSSIEFINNVVYNWGGRSGAHGANPSDTANTNDRTLLNFAGNYYLPGKESPKRPPVYAKPISEKFSVYVFRNFGPGREDDSKDDWEITAGIPEKPYRSLKPAFPLSGISVSDPLLTFRTVLATAGARPVERDEVDGRLLQEIQSNTGKIRDCVLGCENSAGPWPKYSENRRELNLPLNANAINPKSGYTELEEWLFCFADNLERKLPSHAKPDPSEQPHSANRNGNDCNSATRERK